MWVFFQYYTELVTLESLHWLVIALIESNTTKHTETENTQSTRETFTNDISCFMVYLITNWTIFYFNKHHAVQKNSRD